MARTKWWVVAGLAAAVSGVFPAQARAEEAGASPLADDPTMIALAVALACADAPQTGGAVTPTSAEPAATGPELELVATVRAKTLVFDEVPHVDVVFHGSGQRKTVWKTERVNLPAKPEPGVVYRDVVVRLTVTSDIDELTSLLRQAKRAAAGVRIERETAATVVPAGATRPVEIAPPASPAAPLPIAPPAAKPAAPPPAAQPSAPAAAQARPAAQPAVPGAAPTTSPLLAPAPQPIGAPAPAPAAPPAMLPAPAPSPAR
jgi:hypothetical protein